MRSRQQAEGKHIVLGFVLFVGSITFVRPWDIHNNERAKRDTWSAFGCCGRYASGTE